MARGKELTIAIRAQVKLLHDMNFSQVQIANRLKISRCAVQRCISRSQLISRKRSGRPKVTSARTDNSILVMCKRSPRASSSKIQLQLPIEEKVSTRTIRRRLFCSGFKSRRPAKKPMLTRKNIRDRIYFCNKYKNWSPDDWENVMFSDESTFTQFYSFARHVRRPIGSRYDPKYCTSAVKQSAKLMVWAAFSGKGGRGGIWFMPDGRTINAGVYQTILQDKLLPFRAIHGVDYFLHDGAPCHMAKSITKWLHDHSVPVIGPWPGSSPDLNPIENLWVQMEKKVAACNPTSAAHLKEVVKRMWVTETTVEACKTLARSMPKRIASVLAAKGHSTKY
jgi:transposase